MRRYASGAAQRGAESPKMQCAALERRRRRRAWRITDLASPRLALPPLPPAAPSAAVGFPLPRGPSPSGTATSPARDGATACAARHCPALPALRIHLSSLFIIRHCRHRRRAAAAALHFALAISRCSKRGTAAGSAQSAAVNNV